MTTKQHIYTGIGNPFDNNTPVDGECHHYLDTSNGDIWQLSNASTGWVLIYASGSAGPLAAYAEGPGLEPPEGAAGPYICITHDRRLLLKIAGVNVEIPTVPQE